MPMGGTQVANRALGRQHPEDSRAMRSDRRYLKAALSGQRPVGGRCSVGEGLRGGGTPWGATLRRGGVPWTDNASCGVTLRGQTTLHGMRRSVGAALSGQATLRGRRHYTGAALRRRATLHGQAARRDQRFLSDGWRYVGSVFLFAGNVRLTGGDAGSFSNILPPQNFGRTFQIENSSKLFMYRSATARRPIGSGSEGS